jgi:anti-sigma factor RsiW
MRECPFESRLGAYHDDELDAQTSDRLAAHLTDCPQCSSSLQAIRQMSRMIASAPTRPVSQIGMARLHAVADAAAKQGTVFPLAKALLAIAASLLIIGSAWLVEMPGRNATQTPVVDPRSFDELDSLATGGRLILPANIARDTDVAVRQQGFEQWMIDNITKKPVYEIQHR